MTELNDIDTDDSDDSSVSDHGSDTSIFSRESTVKNVQLPSQNEVMSDDSMSIDEFIPSSASEDESDELDIDEFGLYENMEKQEIIECQMVTKCDETYDIDEHIFSPIEMNELRVRELALIDRNQKGYYRCKVRHAKL